MKNPIEWNVQLDGQDNAFSYNMVKGQHILVVNGQQVPVVKKFMQAFVGVDEPFMLNGREARFVLNGKKPDVVVDGLYVSNGKPYVPFPKWYWVFFAFNILIPILTLGGALPIIFAFLGISGCAKVSRSFTMPSGAKVGVCIAITLGCWLLTFILLIGVGILQIMMS